MTDVDFDLTAALDALPMLPADVASGEAAELRATGTDGQNPVTGPVTGNHLAPRRVRRDAVRGRNPVTGPVTGNAGIWCPQRPLMTTKPATAGAKKSP
ncbi:MAG TPA: hypothetical protein VMV69_02555 [Pirellulales bacterium]|nr:hypothetical protein [Pirellulales bacterium]